MDRDAETPIAKLENLEGRATRDFFAGDYGRPQETHSSARLLAFDMLNDATNIAERKLFALIDAAASLLMYGGGEESARLCLEVVTTSTVAGDVVRTLVHDRGAG